jgi:hypothetical protein
VKTGNVSASNLRRSTNTAARAPQAHPPVQPAKTTLFAGGIEPGLRRNFLRPID